MDTEKVSCINGEYTKYKFNIEDVYSFKTIKNGIVSNKRGKFIRSYYKDDEVIYEFYLDKIITCAPICRFDVEAMNKYYEENGITEIAEDCSGNCYCYECSLIKGKLPKIFYIKRSIKRKIKHSDIIF